MLDVPTIARHVLMCPTSRLKDFCLLFQEGGGNVLKYVMSILQRAISCFHRGFTVMKILCVEVSVLMNTMLIKLCPQQGFTTKDRKQKNEINRAKI